MRRHVLVLFLDGVGLGSSDPAVNPLAAADMPALRAALGGATLVADSAPRAGPHATLLSIDACLGVGGDPQSATGQAALLTGRNVPLEVGEHYGPKPNPAVAAIVRRSSVFHEVLARGGSAALLNAYPPRYFESISSGRRLYSAIPLAASAAGVPLRSALDLQAGLALSADFTGRGWAEQPGFPPSPVLGQAEAGARLADLARSVDLSWFDFWPSDVAGHRGDMGPAIHLLDQLDAVLGGFFRAWRDGPDLAIITSDHGNLEDLAHRGHTRNPVPGLLIGPADLRAAIAPRLTSLTDFHDVILEVIFGTQEGGQWPVVSGQ